MTTYTFHADLDGGQGGDTTITAESIREAVIQAIEWAADGDWGNAQENTEDCYGGCRDVDIHVWREDDDGEIIEDEYASYTIPTLGDLIEQELDDDGEVLVERSGEFETEQIVRVGEDYYHRIENGGDRGAHNRQCGDGVWREYPVQGAELLTRTEARAKLLDMGVEPAEVARLTHD